KRTFNPEFLNRLDEIILFMALSEQDLIQILELMVSLLNQNLAQKSITVTVTDEAKKWILNQTLGDRSYGARPLRRALQKYIEDRSEEHTSELQSHRDLHSFPTRRSSDLTVTDEAKKWILNQTLGDRSYGARPLRRALQKYIEDPLSEALIQGPIPTRPA